MNHRCPRQQAYSQAGGHQQGRSGNPQPFGESRHHGRQRDQQYHGLNIAHAADLASSIR
jgi:hypothetical protein